MGSASVPTASLDGPQATAANARNPADVQRLSFTAGLRSHAGRCRSVSGGDPLGPARLRARKRTAPNADRRRNSQTGFSDGAGVRRAAVDWRCGAL